MKYKKFIFIFTLVITSTLLIVSIFISQLQVGAFLIALICCIEAYYAERPPKIYGGRSTIKVYYYRKGKIKNFRRNCIIFFWFWFLLGIYGLYTVVG